MFFFGFRKEQFQRGIDWICCICVIHCISFVKNCEVLTSRDVCRTGTPLPICQSRQTTSLSVSVSIPHSKTWYFALFAKKPPPSIRSNLCRAKFGPKDLLSRGGTLLFRRFLLCRRSDSSFFLVGLILGLNQPFCPHIWRWAGSGVRLGNDGIQSTELDEQIILHEEYLYPQGDPKKVCVTLCKFVMVVQWLVQSLTLKPCFHN